MVDYAQLGIEIDSSDIGRGEARLQSFTNQAQTTERQVAASSSRITRGFGAIGGAARSVGNSFRNIDARNASMQLSQVAQQTSATGNFLQSLAIQLPDLALGFGTFGIAAGAAAGALMPLASSMLSSQGRADDLGSSMERVAATAEGLDGSIELLTQSVSDLRQEFGDAAERTRDFARFQADLRVAQATETLRQQVGVLRDVADQYYRLSDITSGPSGYATEYALTIGRISDDFGLAADQARQFETAIQRASTADTLDGQVEALQEIKSLLDEAGVEASDIPSEVANALDQMITYVREVDRAKNTTHDLGTITVDVKDNMRLTADQVERLAQNMSDAYSNAQSMSQITMENLAFGGATPGRFGGTIDAVRRYRGLAESADQGILELIGQVESAGDYNRSLENGRFRPGGSDARSLVNMTINEVLAEQRSMLQHPENDHNSSAAGRYQIVSRTLRSLVDDLDLTGDELYSPQMQDRLARQLLRRRQGQGVSGLRNEWEGLRNVPDELIHSALGQQSISRSDPITDRQQARAQREANREQERQNRLLERSQTAYDNLLGSLDPVVAAQQEYRTAQEDVNRALDNGQISAEEARHAMTLAEMQMQDTINTLEAELPEATQSGADAMANLFTSITSGASSASEAISQLLLQAGGNWISNGFSALAGTDAGGGVFSAIGSFIGGGRARGGPVRAGTPYLVNEDTPNSEVMVPSRSGGVLNVPQAQAALRDSAGGTQRVQVELVSDGLTLSDNGAVMGRVDARVRQSEAQTRRDMPNQVRQTMRQDRNQGRR